MNERRKTVTHFLDRGDHEALHSLLYDELREIADRRMGSERSGHTLQATALVHEAYLRLLAEQDPDWDCRRHFYAAATSAMNRILIEHARRVRSEKRGGDARRVSLGAADAEVELDTDQAAGLRDALEVLEAEDERAAAVVRLRFLAGLSVEETAQALSISIRSVHREWTFARARLFELLDS